MPLTFGSEGDKEEKLPGPIEARSEFVGAFPRKRILSPGEFAAYWACGLPVVQSGQCTE